MKMINESTAKVYNDLDKKITIKVDVLQRGINDLKPLQHQFQIVSNTTTNIIKELENRPMASELFHLEKQLERYALQDSLEKAETVCKDKVTKVEAE